ncbi:aminopeptidase N [Kaistia algarum]|uniref:aminopeptidase N n=1 Tax=Kaistia algarum TaxID=2083279 RepID=UPI000CE92377|nr:aminopeptidase N [Kaistia algarum]MCX5512096.1 aminopeptidase N [Kaistia algarum]PPE80212.1 aminopeptidase N [Kaistia algarum]
MKSESAPFRLEDYRPPAFTIDRVDLDFRLSPSATRVTARLSIRPNTADAASGRLELVGDEILLKGLKLDGLPLPASRFTALPSSLSVRDVPNTPFELEIETEIDPSANTKLMGLYRTNGNYCTQCEAEGFRRITYFLDRPDVLAVYTTRIEAEKADAPILLGNGNPGESGDIPGTTRHYAIWHDPFPKPSYLFALVAGDLGVLTDRFTTRSGKPVELRIYCEHGKEARCTYAMDALKRSMKWDEDVFGLEYDLDIFIIVAVSDFNMGAMENKGLNIFNDKYVLADPDTASDIDYANVEGVIAHEYFHNWTGNRITCRDWFQLCLKEGLTVFRDQEFSSDMRSRPVKRIADVRTLQARQFPEDGGPLAHPVRPEIYHEISNFYTPTVYEKGAEVVRMLRTILGAEGFRRGMDLYFERHDGDAATIEDFLACFSETTGSDLAQFKLWYSQAGTPQIVAKGHYDEASRSYRLTLAQNVPPTPGQPVKKSMHIPVRFGLIGPNGEDLDFSTVSGGKVEGDVIHMTEPAQTFVFHEVAARPVPSLMRAFSAPVRLAIDLSSDDLLFQVRADKDPFNRWQAAQTLAMRALVAGTSDAAQGRHVQVDPTLVSALAEILEDETLEPAFRAQVLQIPGESDIAREIGQDVDPDAIATARRQLRLGVTRGLGARLADRYRAFDDHRLYSPDAADAGRRALRNVLLDLMVASGAADAIAAARHQFETADNMTDRLAALSAVSASALAERRHMLEAFYERYQGDALVLDKWLMLEATVPALETLDRVKTLLVHPAFALSNPNRVRALVGGFSSSNPTQFNRADGAGFDFLADFVLDLDRRNPQTAARLLIAFRSWRALEPVRRGLAEAQLRRIAASDRLSPDTQDIVTRTLA